MARKAKPKEPFALSDDQVRDFLGNVKFALYFAHKFSRRFPQVDFDDLRQIALLALVQSISKTKHFAPSFSRSVIVYDLQLFVDNTGSLIRIPKTKRGNIRKMGADPDFEKTLSKLQKKNIESCRLEMISLDDPVPWLSDDDVCWKDLIPEEKSSPEFHSDEYQSLSGLITRTLSEKEALVINHLYLKDEPLKREDVAKILGMCVSSVRYIESKALKKLRLGIK